jgi:hypothetical protein
VTAAREYKARIAELTAGFDDDAERNAQRVSSWRRRSRSSASS